MDADVSSDDIASSAASLNPRRTLFSTLSFPEYSATARVYGLFMAAIVVLSVAVLIVSSYSSITKIPAWERSLFWLDVGTSIVFGVDYVLRLALSINRLEFLIDLYNTVDLLSFLPLFIELIVLAATSTASSSAKGLAALRVLRLFRLLRLFKMTRKLVMMEVLMYALRQASKAILLLYFIILVFCVLSGALLYFVETAFCRFDVATGQWLYKDSVVGYASTPTGFQDILVSMWWALVTAATVGYGDISPVTWAGRLVGSVVLAFSVVVFALPIALLGSSFSDRYQEMKANRISINSRYRSMLGDKSARTVGILTWDNLPSRTNVDIRHMFAQIDDQLAEQQAHFEAMSEELDSMRVQCTAFSNELLKPL